jgi:hypothetical protein
MDTVLHSVIYNGELQLPVLFLRGADQICFQRGLASARLHTLEKRSYCLMTPRTVYGAGNRCFLIQRGDFYRFRIRTSPRISNQSRKAIIFRITALIECMYYWELVLQLTLLPLHFAIMMGK